MIDNISWIPKYTAYIIKIHENINCDFSVPIPLYKPIF